MKKLNKEDYKICIVGLGYVGLPLAARFSIKGFDVTGFDIKEERINQLVKSGLIMLYLHLYVYITNKC